MSYDGKTDDMFGGAILGQKLKNAYAPDRRMTLPDRVLAHLIVRAEKGEGLPTDSGPALFRAARIAPAVQSLREEGWNIETRGPLYMLIAEVDE